MYDTDGRMLAMNGRLGDLTGFDARRLVGSPLPPPWWPADAAAELEADVRRLLAGGPPVEMPSAMHLSASS